MKRRRVRLISVLQPFREPPVKGILIPDHLCRQLLDVRKNKVVKGSGLNLMAGADLAAEAVIGLADIVGLIDGFPLRFRRAVHVCPPDLLIPRLHGLAAVRTV